MSFCADCGLIWNARFKGELLEYSQAYDNSLDFSPTFQEYASSLARRLLDDYELAGRQIVELGCGKGRFLHRICSLGQCSGVGFDPSYEGPRQWSDSGAKLEFIQDFYGRKYAATQGDLIVCRHVLEHIPDPAAFLEDVKATMGERPCAKVYFEVPNTRFILEGFSIWDIIYEHCNYFTVESAARLFESVGFGLLRVSSEYGGQFVGVDASLEAARSSAKPCRGDLSDLARLVDTFSEAARSLLNDWRSLLDEMRWKGKRVVLWGAGAKSVGFLNLLKDCVGIEQVVDINPNKQGKFLPGTGQEIVSASALKDLRPDLVIVMNPIYRGEVERSLMELGVTCELAGMSPSVARLP